MSLEAPDNTKQKLLACREHKLALARACSMPQSRSATGLAPGQEDASLGAITEQTSINGPGVQTAEALQNHLGSKRTAPRLEYIITDGESELHAGSPMSPAHDSTDDYMLAKCCIHFSKNV